MQTIADQFTDITADTAKIQQMAEFIAVEDDAVSQMAEALQERKNNLDQLKTDLATLMIQSGMDSVKLDNGLTPKAKITTKYYKAQGVDDETLFSWLEHNDLDGIIKPTVHFSTLNKALADYVDHWGDLPNIFQRTDTPTVTMYGKSKFLARRNSQ